jgi:hypothetical protein
MFFKRNKTIEFIHSVPGVAELMPIIPAKNHKHKWVERALENFSEVRQNHLWKHQRTTHITRCPGIFSLQRHGWILRTWQDIEIETNGDGKTFTWRTPSKIGEDYVGFHDESQLAKFFSVWPDNTLRTVIKIQSGWSCIVPNGYYLLEMPVPLLEDHRFTTVSGYLSKESGPAVLNVQLLWHVLKGKTLIPAGTPIAQYILVPKQLPEIVCRDMKPGDKIELFKLFNGSRWVNNYSELKKLFS